MNNSRQSDIPGYLYALDGMRAISLIFIVIFHTFQQSWIFYNLKISPDKYLFNFEIFQRYGYVAIDSFFVLSGFCLFYPIARSMFGECEFRGWKNFFIKRACKKNLSFICHNAYSDYSNSEFFIYRRNVWSQKFYECCSQCYNAFAFHS